MLLTLAAIWGSSFMFIKVAMREVAPAEVVFGRVLVGTVALLPAVPFLLGWGRTLASLRRFWFPLLLLGVFNAAVPFWLLAWSEKKLDSGLAGVLQASMPLFTAVLVYSFSRSDRVTGLRLAGVVVGFFGVLLLVGEQPRGDVLSALALFYGAAFLGEPVTMSALGGLALILAGVALGTGTLRLDRLRPAARDLSG